MQDLPQPAPSPPPSPPPPSSSPPPPPASPSALEHEADMPRERLLRLGAPALSDGELIALLLGTGTRGHPVLQLAADVVHAIGGVMSMSRASPYELAGVRGVGAARAARIAAAFELGRRVRQIGDERVKLASAEDVYRCVAPRMIGALQEIVLVAGLDLRNHLIDIVEVARGSACHVELHPREVFRPLIRMAAAGGLVIHNHPSGDATPSSQDRELTVQLRALGWALGLPIVDHVIVGDSEFRSLAEWMGGDF